jgi:secreted PhoX family phosphatase
MAMRAEDGSVRELDQEVEAHVKGIERLLEQQASASGTTLDAPSAQSQERSSAASGAAQLDRRSFLRSSAAVVSSAAIVGTLGMLHERKVHAHGGPTLPPGPIESPYGAPVPAIDETTGLALIGLPPDFCYWSHGWTGDPIFDLFDEGPKTPALHDGMAVVREIGPLAILCRNHEVGAGTAFVKGSLQYSPAAGGGNTNMIFDMRRRKWVGVWPTLSGTVRNCAGGYTDHHSWLSCEETGDSTTDPATGQVYTHGWCYDVPAIGVSNGKPIKEMGRRSHEACAVDPRTGYVYLTEDASPGGVYRFRPNRTRPFERPYSNGGTLEMLKVPVTTVSNANLQGTRHGGPVVNVGDKFDVAWVKIDYPENNGPGGLGNFAQGLAKGGAIFRRPEGAWYSDGTVFFVSTDGGSSGNGQVFALDVKRQTLQLIYDSPHFDDLDNPDNLTVTPRGGLLFCEDGAGNGDHLHLGQPTERLVGLTENGHIFTFANNLIDFRAVSAGGMGPYTRPSGTTFSSNSRSQEWAGATFSRDGDWLFVNIQTPGVTFAITGPWHRGPL